MNSKWAHHRPCARQGRPVVDDGVSDKRDERRVASPGAFGLGAREFDGASGLLCVSLMVNASRATDGIWYVAELWKRINSSYTLLVTVGDRDLSVAEDF